MNEDHLTVLAIFSIKKRFVLSMEDKIYRDTGLYRGSPARKTGEWI
jgi:hypothetical protein